MKKIVFSFLSIISFTIINAQQDKTVVDSTEFYEKEIGKLHKAYRDSLNMNPKLAILLQNIRRLKANKDNYSAFAMYVDITSADFQKLNADNSLINFSPVSGPVLSFGFGYSSKKGRRIFDFNFMTFGLNKTSKKDKESIKTSFTNFFQMQWGYDLIKNKAINFYPYAGIGIRSTSLTYNGMIQINPSPTNISNIIQNDPSVSDNYGELSYQAGLGFEFVLSNPNKSVGSLLFIKGGINRPFKEKKFDFGGYKYDPGFNYGQWMITTGIKLFGR